MTLFRKKYRIASTRLKGWDYGAAGYYFVTICTKNRQCFFGNITVETLQCNVSTNNIIMQLSPIGEIAHRFWQEIPSHHTGIEIDEFIIMPNHMHGIVIITDKPRRDVACNVSTTCNISGSNVSGSNVSGSSVSGGSVSGGSVSGGNVSTSGTMSEISPKSGSLGVIVRSYKSAVTRWCKKNGFPDFAWQARFYERIIRDDKGLNKAREYILNNPQKWEIDRENLSNIWM